MVLVVAIVALSVLAGTARGTETALPISSVSALADSRSEGLAVSATGSGVGSSALFRVDASTLGEFRAEPPDLTSPSAIVINMNTGHVLYTRKADLRRPMASTTKIMTAMLCLENLSLSKEVTVSSRAASISEVKPFLVAGDVLTVEQLLNCLLVHSSNAAAMALAEAVDGEMEVFAERMNAKAAELGLQDTSFKNPSGLDAEGHYSTAADMAVLGRHAMQNEQFRRLVSVKEYTLEVPGRGKSYHFENTNKLMLSTPWVVGVKTGLTPKAKQCLVAAGTNNGVAVMSVLLGQPSTKVCWEETRALLQYGLSQYRHVTLLESGVAVAEADVPYNHNGKVRLLTDGRLEIDLYKEDVVEARVKIDRDLTLPVSEGTVFGQVWLVKDGDTVSTVDVVADSSYKKPTLGTKIGHLWSRFTRWLGRAN